VSRSSNDYLPIHITKPQAELIQRLLLDDEVIPIESLLRDLSLPVEQMLKSILESIIIESPEENKYRAKLILMVEI
jgi:bifunctional DNase/RNase